MKTDLNFNLAQSNRYIHFGEFCIDQLADRVFRGQTQLEIDGKCYEILMIFVRKSGQIVTREEIRQALWHAEANIDVASNIYTRIHNLRQVLGDSRSKATYIETIPRKGYIFNVVPVFSSKAGHQSADLGQDDLNAAASLVSDTGPPAQKYSWVGCRRIAMILVLAGILLLGVGLTLIPLIN